MRKIRKLSLFVILGVVICALIFIGISSLEAQNKGKKPDNPPGKPDKEEKPGEDEAIWAVRIPISTSFPYSMFYGRGDGYYENNDYIKVSVKKNTMAGPWRKYFNFGYAFDFTLTNENVETGEPSANQVGFRNVCDLDDVTYPDVDKVHCVFPGTIMPPPNCMADFLNGTHPHAGGTDYPEEDYQYFWCRVNVFDYDIESMQVGPENSYLFGGDPDTDRDASEPGDYLSMVARYRRDCYPEPAYHDVEIYRNINYWRAIGLGNPLNIEIEMLDLTDYEIVCEAAWRIWVRPIGFNGIDGFLKVKERYCTVEKNKTKWYYPMVATGNFSFYIDFIKNPTTQ